MLNNNTIVNHRFIVLILKTRKRVMLKYFRIHHDIFTDTNTPIYLLIHSYNTENYDNKHDSTGEIKHSNPRIESSVKTTLV